MARRLILGDDGSGSYHFKVSKPGIDAATAPLDQLLFDARNVPFRYRYKGEVSVPAKSSGGGASRPANSTLVAHGLGTVPWILAIARPQETAPNNAQWWVWKNGPSWAYLNAGGLPNGSWTAPWRQEGQTGDTSGQYYGGWWHDADATHVAFYTWGCGLIVRWGYLEV